MSGTAGHDPDSMTDSEKLNFLVVKVSTICTELDETKIQVMAITTRLDGHAARIAHTEQWHADMGQGPPPGGTLST